MILQFLLIANNDAIPSYSKILFYTNIDAYDDNNMHNIILQKFRLKASLSRVELPRCCFYGDNTIHTDKKGGGKVRERAESRAIWFKSMMNSSSLLLGCLQMYTCLVRTYSTDMSTHDARKKIMYSIHVSPCDCGSLKADGHSK